jgi:tetratricopeptide (TPR) repeat protein
MEGADMPSDEQALPEDIRRLLRIDLSRSEIAGKTDEFDRELQKLVVEIAKATGLPPSFAFRPYEQRPNYFPPGWEVADPFGGPNTPEAVRRAMQEHGSSNGQRVLILTGARGTGKTQLALKFADEPMQRLNYAGVWVFRSANTDQLNEDAGKLCDLLKLPMGTAGPLQSVNDWLMGTTQKWLLVFDGLPKDEQLVLPSLRRAKHDILVTSFDRGSLASWECLQMAAWSQADAVTWLCKRWPELPESAARSLAEACECSPPFLELCARRGRDRTYPLEQLTKDLKRAGAARILVGAEQRDREDPVYRSAGVSNKGIAPLVLRFLRIVSHLAGSRLGISDFVFCEEAVLRLFPDLAKNGVDVGPAIQDKLLTPAIATGIVDRIAAASDLASMDSGTGGSPDAIRIIQAFADQVLWGAEVERRGAFGDACMWLELAIRTLVTAAVEDEDSYRSNRLERLLASGLLEAANAALHSDLSRDLRPGPWIEYANALYLLEKARKPSTAVSKLEEIVDTQERSGPDMKLLRVVRRALISAYVRNEKPERALAACKAILAGEKDADTWKDMHACAQVLSRLGDPETARAIQGELLAQLRESPMQQKSVWALVPGYIDTLSRCNRLKEAMSIGLETLDEIRAVGGSASDRRIVESIEFNLANVARKMEDYKTALQYDTSVVESRRSRLGNIDHPDVALAIISKAATQIMCGLVDRSDLAGIEAAYRTLAKSLPDGHSYVSHAQEIVRRYREISRGDQ